MVLSRANGGAGAGAAAGAVSRIARADRATRDLTMLLCALVLAALAAAAAQNETRPPAPRREQFRVIYEWTAIDFDWPSPTDREAYLNTSKYIPQNVLISGISYYGGNLYVTVPRMMAGVPATLATIPVNQSDTAPKLRPFPSWSANAVGDCNALQFVQNAQIDRNGIMWILDNGRVGTLTEKPDSKCPPSIVLVDLKAGKTDMERIPIPSDSTDYVNTYLNDLVVDNRRDGDYAYITDNSASDPGIIVFRRSDKKMWKVRDSKSMMAAPESSIFRINGTTVELPVNVDGIALGPQFQTEDGVDRTIYYCPLSSFHMYAINASVLRNESAGRKDGDIRPYVVDLGIKASQTDGMKMDSNGVLYFGLVGNSTIAEWNTSLPFQFGQRTIARDPNYIQWVDRFAFDDNGNVYVVVNRLFNFMKNEVSLNEVNYRILKSHTGSKSYVFGEDLLPPGGLPGGAPALPTLGASLVLLALAHLLA